jgi:DNA-binding NarL/FixJ family response regulator
MIRLAVVEDDPRFRDSVQAAVALADDVTLSAVAMTRREGLALLDGPAADVLLVDLGLPDGSGIDVIAAAQHAWPDCAVMVATLFGDEERVLASISAGAAGYLLKDELAPGIVEAIRTLHAGGSPISPIIARRLLRQFRPVAVASNPTLAPEVAQEPLAELSERERAVLDQIAQGYVSNEIAESLGVSPWTVQTYIRRIYRKLGVRSRAAVVVEAHRRGLLNDEGRT